jgi:hypothetical protein
MVRAIRAVPLCFRGCAWIPFAVCHPVRPPLWAVGDGACRHGEAAQGFTGSATPGRASRYSRPSASLAQKGVSFREDFMQGSTSPDSVRPVEYLVRYTHQLWRDTIRRRLITRRAP